MTHKSTDNLEEAFKNMDSLMKGHHNNNQNNNEMNNKNSIP